MRNQIAVSYTHLDVYKRQDVLCTDKTGTLTQDQILLKRHTDILGEENDRVLEYAYLNSHYPSGLQNLLDIAVLEHADIGKHLHLQHSYEKIDELPFDFTRRRLSVVLSREDGSHLLICKGAFEEMLSISSHCEINGEVLPLDPSHLEAAKAETKRLKKDGFRFVAAAYKELDLSQRAFKIADESDLILIGYIAFLDPPKDSAKAALAALKDAGVRVKVLTGDNEIVTRTICRDVGLGTPLSLIHISIWASTRVLCRNRTPGYGGPLGSVKVNEALLTFAFWSARPCKFLI